MAEDCDYGFDLLWFEDWIELIDSLVDEVGRNFDLPPLLIWNESCEKLIDYENKIREKV